jgi:SAM-dependent methyltransferase
MGDYYATRYAESSGRSKVWKAIVEYLAKYINGYSLGIIDVGCGYGDFINNIQGSRLVAVDLNPNAEQYLKEGVEFFCSSATDLSFIDSASVDLLFTSNLLEHLTDLDLDAAISEFKRVLKVGGVVITMQPNFFYAYREYFDDYTHKKVFSHESLVDFFKANGFSLVSIERRFMPFSLKSRLPKSYWLTKFYLWSFYRPFAKQMLGIFRKIA